MKIMFICTGNTCRSAMAEAILRKKVQERNIDVEVCSAGIYAENGDEPTDVAIEVMENKGIDMKGHKATNIKNSKIVEMDLILCATNSQKLQVMTLYPELKEKIYTIKEYAYGENGDIQDPWGNSLRVYGNCAKELEESIDKIIEKL